MTIGEEVARMGRLQNVAGAIVDYVRAISVPSKGIFEYGSGEWTLKPDNWINLKFAYQRVYKVTVSLGVYTTTLDPVPGINLKPGRFGTWTKFQIESSGQLASAMKLIEDAFYSSDNGYRRMNGWPPRPAKADSFSIAGL
jgi:hypothetical protein